jgi:HD-like signal output (HDOD) protein/GGDEF domain-containing protein
MTTGQKQSILDQFAKRARRLYSLPTVAMQVVELTREPDIDTQALKTCIEQDPALSTKILRVVNSSLFGLSQKIGDLNRALAILGTKPLKLLVLGFSLPRDLLSDVEASVLNRYWRQTLTKAVAAREIAEIVWNLPGDEAFIAGLLQDIGMLALVQDLGDTYVDFLNRVHEQGEDLTALELSILGFDHAMLSARMLHQWGLPDALVRAVALPRTACGSSDLDPQEGDLCQILHLACLLTEFLIHPNSALLKDVLETGRRYKALTESQLELLVAKLQEKVPLLADVLSLQLPDGTDYNEILLKAHEQLSKTLDDATSDLFGEASQASALLMETNALSRAVERFVGTPLVDAPRSCQTAVATAPEPPNAIQQSELQQWAVRAPTDVHGLLSHVTAAVGHCRQSRSAVSLLLAEIDDFETLLITQGIEQANHLLHMLASAIEVTTDEEGKLLQLQEARLALILKGYDRQKTVGLTRRLLEGVRYWSRENNGPSFSISVGIAALALPPKNFPSQELIDAAERCLSGVQLSGGDGLRSIDIY